MAIVVAAGSARAAYVPARVGVVNDFAALFSRPFTQLVEEDLAGYNKKTRTEIVVLTVISSEDERLASLAASTFIDWRVGEKYKDNGILIVFDQEANTATLEVGEPLAIYLTEERRDAIVENDMKPALAAGDYEQALTAALFSVKAYVGGLPAALAPIESSVAPIDSIVVVFGFILLRLLFGGLVGEMAGTKSVWLGIVYGAVFGIYGSLIFGSVEPFSILAHSGLFAFVGLILDWALSEHLAHRLRVGLGYHHLFGPAPRTHRRV